MSNTTNEANVANAAPTTGKYLNDPCQYGPATADEQCLTNDRTTDQPQRRRHQRTRANGSAPTANKYEPPIAATYLGKVRHWPTHRLLRQLKSMGITIVLDRFKARAQSAYSAVGLLLRYYLGMANSEPLSLDDEHFITCAIYDLWCRTLPELICEEMIDEQFELGYVALHAGHRDVTIEYWYKGWDLTEKQLRTRPELFENASPELVNELNYAAKERAIEMDRVLHNMALDMPAYHRERIRFWARYQEIYPVLPPTVHPIMLLCLAEAYWLSEDLETGAQLFEEHIETYPKDAWGYHEYAHMHNWGMKKLGREPDIARAEQILNWGLASDVDVDDRAVLLDALGGLA